ncbi:FMN-binding negative transcriptional regulator [Celerinatantimonas sp. YJH-8]|uniref:FMN-binding negative transcriptional regulator n=1 Tax=Celerinatantimonas sp. YJH-8 TaxID=3228714 RepID=UPI0038BF4DE1
MFIPRNMEMTDDQAIIDFINEFGFGLMVSPLLDATHVPMQYQEDPQNGMRYLYGHLAKINPQWKDSVGERVLAVFSGPHAYISPTWYAGQPAVPTWNYTAVHCYGTLELLNAEQMAVSMDELVTQYEPALHQNSELMPAEYKQKLAKAVVGFRIEIDTIQAQEKLDQQRRPADQQGVYEALSTSAHSGAVELANYMKKRNLGTGRGA